MQIISNSLLAHLRNQVTTLASCWKIKRSDGVLIGFTDHDQNLVIDGLEYDSICGFDPSNQENTTSMQPSSGAINLFGHNSKITFNDLKIGLYNEARLSIFIVNWQDPSAGKIIQCSGILGDVTYKDNMFYAEMRNLSQFLSQNLCEVYSANCRARLGDIRCKIDMSLHKVDSMVLDIISTTEFKADLNKEPGWCNSGWLVFNNGENKNIKMEIRSYDSGIITLAIPAFKEIKQGDIFTAYAGCDKSFHTCHKKFGNSLNFRGEPGIPCMDDII